MHFPLIGLFLRWINIGFVDKGHLIQYMKSGLNFTILPGGFEE